MIIKCKECGGDVSDKAATCPHCGYSMKSNTKTDDGLKINPKSDWTPSPTKQNVAPKIKKEKKKHGCLWGIVLVICVLGFFCWITDDNDNDDAGKNYNQETVSDNQQTKKEEKNKTEYDLKKIYSGHKCNIAITSGDDEGFSFEIENNSKKDFSFDVHSMAINGVMTNCNIYSFSTSVPSGKKGTMDVDFEDGWLSKGDKVQYVDLVIWAYDDAKNYRDFYTKKIRIKTNNFKGENKFSGGKGSKKKSGFVILKEKLDSDKFVFSVINNNNYYANLDFTNASVDGWALETDYLFDTQDVCVYPKSVTTITADISDLTSKKGIENPKSVEFSLKYRKNGDYFKEKTIKKLKF